MAALEQFQRALGFADAGLALNEDAQAVDVNEHAVDRRGGGEAGLEDLAQLADEDRGVHVRAQEGYPVLLAGLH